MNFLDMISDVECGRLMLIYDGESYTYADMISMAEEAAEAMRGGALGSMRVIKRACIIEQLTCFFACYVCGYIPLIVPYDDSSYEDGQLIELREDETREKPCVAVATSGTTGEPKIYFRTYESWAGYFHRQNEIFMIDAGTRLFCHGSLAFTGNLNLYLGTFFEGGAVIASDKLSPEIWLQDISEANMIYLIPSKLIVLSGWSGKKYENIRMILSGSQSLGREDCDRLKELFPRTEILLYYGASELSYITYVRDKDMTDDRNLVGTPFPDVRVSIEDGRICVDTKWHVTGISVPYTMSDMGYMDDDGRLYFAGRSDDIMHIRGRKISAVKVENELMTCPLIAEAAVRPDEKQRITAWVVLNGYTEDTITDIRRYISDRNNLAPYERPKRIIITEALSRNDSGKIDKNRLEERQA